MFSPLLDTNKKEVQGETGSSKSHKQRTSPPDDPGFSRFQQKLLSVVEPLVCRQELFSLRNTT